MSDEDFLIFRNNLAHGGWQNIAAAADCVREWLAGNPNAQYVEASDILDTFRDVDPAAVVRALALMSETGLMEMKYAIAPRSTHTRLEMLFSSPAEIPTELHDWKQCKFQRDDAEIFPVFLPAWG